MKKHVLFLFLLGAALLVAQQKPTQPVPGQPQLSEVEKLKLENLNLKYAAFQRTIQDAQKEQQELGAEYRVLAAAVRREHPGFALGSDGNLVPEMKPTPAPVSAPPAPKPQEKPKK